MFGPLLSVRELLSSLTLEEQSHLAEVATSAQLVELVAEVNDERFGYEAPREES